MNNEFAEEYNDNEESRELTDRELNTARSAGSMATESILDESGMPDVAEVLHNPEELMRSLVSRIDRGLHELGVPARTERGWGWCNFVPDAVSYCATRDAEENGYNVKVLIFQNQDLHKTAAGKQTLAGAVPEILEFNPESPAPHPPEIQERIHAYYDDPEIKSMEKSDFRHGFNVIWINDVPFIVDLTFSQFFMGEGDTLTQGGDDLSSGVSRDDTVAQALIHTGFLPLTDENLRTYMRFLTTGPKEYLGRTTTDLVNKVKPVRFSMERNELLGKIPPAYGGILKQ